MDGYQININTMLQKTDPYILVELAFSDLKSLDYIHNSVNDRGITFSLLSSFNTHEIANFMNSTNLSKEEKQFLANLIYSPNLIRLYCSSSYGQLVIPESVTQNEDLFSLEESKIHYELSNSLLHVNDIIDTPDEYRIHYEVSTFYEYLNVFIHNYIFTASKKGVEIDIKILYDLMNTILNCNFNGIFTITFENFKIILPTSNPYDLSDTLFKCSHKIRDITFRSGKFRIKKDERSDIILSAFQHDYDEIIHTLIEETKKLKCRYKLKPITVDDIMVAQSICSLLRQLNAKGSLKKIHIFDSNLERELLYSQLLEHGFSDIKPWVL